MLNAERCDSRHMPAWRKAVVQIKTIGARSCAGESSICRPPPVTFWVGSNHEHRSSSLSHSIRASFDRPKIARPTGRRQRRLTGVEIGARTAATLPCAITYGRIPGGGHWVGTMPATDFEAQRRQMLAEISATTGRGEASAQSLPHRPTVTQVWRERRPQRCPEPDGLECLGPTENSFAKRCDGASHCPFRKFIRGRVDGEGANDCRPMAHVTVCY